MHAIYILYSIKDEKLYVGCTNNLKRRLTQHHAGQVLATKHRRPLALIHSEEFIAKGEAFQRERFLKSLWSGRFKKELVVEYKKQTSPQ